MLRPAVESLPEMKDAFSESMENLSALDKQILVERHLIEVANMRRKPAAAAWC